MYKHVIEKLKIRKVYAWFKGDILAADLVDLILLFSHNQDVTYLLAVIDVYSKYAWITPLTKKPK